MEHFPSTLTREQSAGLLGRVRAGIEELGYGFWATELVGRAPLIGFIGVRDVEPEFPFAPAIEVGWRLARPFWGQSLAYEGAQASLEFAFQGLAREEVVAYTTAGNARSRALMERLGMERDPREDFLHPGFAPEHPLARHVLYRLARP